MRWQPFAILGGVSMLGLAAYAATRRTGVNVIDLAPAFSNTRPRKKPVQFIVIHHTDTMTHNGTLAVLRDRGLSTHFEVEKDGTIYRYLDPKTTIAEHGGWTNDHSIGIDVTHKSGAPFPELQVQAVAALVADLCQQFGIPGTPAPDGPRWDSLAELPTKYGIFRHRNVRPTACPEAFPLDRLANSTRRAVT